MIPKKIWKVLNFLVGKNYTPDIVEPEALNAEKVNYYNKYFATVGYDIQKELDINYNFVTNRKLDFEPFKFENESIESIEKMIDKKKLT